jgi:hypothetical protein
VQPGGRSGQPPSGELVRSDRKNTRSSRVSQPQAVGPRSITGRTIQFFPDSERNQVICFWIFYHFVLDLDRRDDVLSAVPTYNWRNVPERTCVNDDVITQFTSAIEDNYIPIEQLLFSRRLPTGPHPWDGMITIILICASLNP